MELQLAFPEETKEVKYHKENPHIYTAFEKKAVEAIGRGYKHMGSQAIFEILRWETNVTAKDDTFKINNNYAAYYARLFATLNPAHKDFFRNRKSKFDNQVNKK